MTFSIILLGVLLILVTFNVGESVYKKLKLKKITLILMLILTLGLYFIPSITLGNFGFSLVGFFLPFAFSIVVLFKVRNIKEYFKMFVAVLVAFALNIVYNLITFDVYESSILQPYLFLGVLLGTLPLFITSNPNRLYASNFIGIALSEIVFYLSRYSIYGDYYMLIGSEKMFAVLLVSFTVSLLTSFFARKIHAFFVKKKHREKESQVAQD